MLTIECTNRLIRSYVKVNKVDYYDHSDILKVAEFTMYEDAECTKPIRTEKTDTKNGIALFDGLKYGETVYIKETKAPAGYQLSDEVVKVVIDDNWINGDDKTRTIIYPDKPLPGGVINTGNASQIMLFAGVFVIAGAAFVIVSRKRRNTK